MTEAQRLADKLTDGTDLSAASLLVAMADEKVDVELSDRHLLAWLEQLGLVKDGDITPLGTRVSLRLRAINGISPVKL